ncbi:RES family NAD+ phosphorylase [Owenweeksia hongkongensis]|uniref:RES family NAD+ phosphorylase n=1 Tax=Owenweeksia hongkongensis TaxID=253245 RepID=UPI003A954AE3
MKLYRITHPNHAYDIRGMGAKLYGGRWNSEGKAVVYTASTISLAMLETMTHTDVEWLRKPFSLNILSIPDSLHIQKLTEDKLTSDWKNFPYSPSTVEYGDNWIDNRLTAILQVPSAVNSFESNFLLNPLHPDFYQIKVEEVKKIKFDLRLVL